MSIFHQHAWNIAALEMLAGGLRLVLLQPCEPRTEQHLLAFLDTFGKRVGLAENVFDFCLRELEPLPGIFLVW